MTRPRCKIRTALCLFALAILLLTLPSPPGGRALDAPAQTTPATFLVRTRDCAGRLQECGTERERVERLLAAHGLHVRRQIPRIGVWEVESDAGLSGDAGSSGTLLAALRQDEEVLWAEPNGWVHASEAVPDDPYYQAQQGHLRLMGLPVAWLFATGDR
jgi:hypothetical protein